MVGGEMKAEFQRVREDVRRLLDEMLDYEHDVRGARAPFSHLRRASLVLTRSLVRLRACKAPRPVVRRSSEPTLLELARDDVKKLYVTKAERQELKDAGVKVNFRFLSPDSMYHDYSSAAMLVAHRYPGLGLRADAELAEVVTKLFTGRARRPTSEVPF